MDTVRRVGINTITRTWTPVCTRGNPTSVAVAAVDPCNIFRGHKAASFALETAFSSSSLWVIISLAYLGIVTWVVRVDFCRMTRR